MALRQILMAMVARGAFVGLVSCVAETQSPPGGLIDADNVVIRRAGQVEPRNGITRTYDAVDTPVTGFSCQGADFFVTRAADVFAWHDTDGVDYQYSAPVIGTVDPQPFRRDVWTQVESRGNLYVPIDSGVMKLEGGGFVRAGLPLYAGIVSLEADPASGSWLATGEQVAYRIVLTRKDSSGLIVRSVPSGALVVQNAGAASGVVVLLSTVYPSWFDAIEIYRTRNFPTSVQVDDEMQLVMTVPSTTVAFNDGVAVAARGATLYTSPSRGGIIEQNNTPPAAAVVAAYKGSVFFGNTRGPLTKTISYSFDFALTVADGIGRRTYTGNTTNASADVTGLSSVVGLERGMVVSGTGIPANTWVTNIVGTTVTLSNVATATTAATPLAFDDAVLVGSSWYALTSPVQLGVPLSLLGVQVATVTPPEGGHQYTAVLETYSRAEATRTMRATHGSAYTPVIADYDDATPTPWTQDVYPGGLYWSKPDEPEHVRPINFAYVGDKAKAILGLVPTRDALFILKEDGVWRLTGVNQNWQIDPYDPTTFCMLPTSVKALNGRGYMLGNKGVVRVGDDGVALVSGPINDAVKPVIDAVQAGFVTSGLYELPDVIGSTAAIFAREAEYLLLRSSSDGAWVYNENTDAWTTWSTVTSGNVSPTLTALFDWSRTGKVVHGLGTLLYTTLLGTDSVLGTITGLMPRFDSEQAVTASVYAPSGALTLSAAVTVLEDDAIQDANGVLWVITEDGVGVTTVQAICTNLAATPFGVGACVLYRSLRCRVTSFGFCEPGGTAKAWQRYTSAFTALKGPHVLRSAYESSEHPHSTPLTYDTQDMRFPVANGMVNAPSGFSYQDTVPGTLGHIRAWMLHASTRWAMAFGTAKLEAVFVDARPMVPGSLPQVGA